MKRMLRSCVIVAVLFFAAGTNMLMAQTPTTWGFETGATGGWTLSNPSLGNVTVSGAGGAVGDMQLRGDFTSPVTLSVGQHLTVSGTMTTSGTGNFAGNDFRFGILNNKGAGGTVASNIWNGTSSSYSGYLGIASTGGNVTNWNGGGVSPAALGILTSTKSNAWNSTTGDKGIGGPASVAANGLPGAYIFAMTLTLIDATHMKFDVSLDNTAGGGTYSLITTATDDGTQNGGVISTNTFTSVVFRISAASTFTSLAFSGVNAALPVELTSFTAAASGSQVNLAWTTATEVNNYGFDIERSNSNSNFEKIGFVKGNGNSNSTKNYSFTDKQNLSGKYNYRLKQIDNGGVSVYSKVIEASIGQPQKFDLSQNYPNPFNPTTTIEFSLPQKSEVNLSVINMLGQVVKEITSGTFEAGTHSVQLNASDIASGVYMYKLQAGNFTSVKKLVLLK